MGRPLPRGCASTLPRWARCLLVRLPSCCQPRQRQRCPGATPQRSLAGNCYRSMREGWSQVDRVCGRSPRVTLLTGESCGALAPRAALRFLLGTAQLDLAASAPARLASRLRRCGVQKRVSSSRASAAATGTWCNGIISAPHAEGPRFNPHCVHCLHKGEPLGAVRGEAVCPSSPITRPTIRRPSGRQPRRARFPRPPHRPSAQRPSTRRFAAHARLAACSTTPSTSPI